MCNRQMTLLPAFPYTTHHATRAPQCTVCTQKCMWLWKRVCVRTQKKICLCIHEPIHQYSARKNSNQRTFLQRRCRRVFGSTSNPSDSAYHILKRHSVPTTTGTIYVGCYHVCNTCNTLQHTATHCNILQHTTTRPEQYVLGAVSAAAAHRQCWRALGLADTLDYRIFHCFSKVTSLLNRLHKRIIALTFEDFILYITGRPRHPRKHSLWIP